MRKIGFLSLILAGVLVLAACGNQRQGSVIEVNEETGVTEYVFTNDDYESADIGTPEKTLNPDTIYASLTYIPEMFYGNYRLRGGEKAEAQYCEEMDYIDYKEIDYTGKENVRHITAIPFEVKAGPETLHSAITKDTGHNWMEVYFKDDSGHLLYELFAYEIQGKTLSLQHLQSFEFDEDANTLTYTLDEDFNLSYEFEFKGTSLTLSAGGKSVTMNAGYIYGDEKEPHFHTEHYVTPGEAAIDTIEEINLNQSEDITYVHFPFIDSEGKRKIIYENSAVMSENGLITFTIPYEDGTKTYQYLYFYLDDDGMILTDGDQIYKYMTIYFRHLREGLEDAVDVNVIDGLSEAKLEALLEQKNEILTRLEEAFAAHNVSANINKETGRVTMDTSFLFDVDSAEISAEGKTYLKDFIEAYSEVILEKAQEGTVTRILIEGHTDTNGSHEYNQTLSERRAEAVSDYCTELQPELKQYIETKGYSFDDPILDKDGNVDMAASRRVEFKFQLNVD